MMIVKGCQNIVYMFAFCREIAAEQEGTFKRKTAPQIRSGLTISLIA